jgi:hypothetical protein
MIELLEAKAVNRDQQTVNREPKTENRKLTTDF